MRLEIRAFTIPKGDDQDYWHKISSLVSTNSLVGLNDIIPGLKSQKLRIPENLARVTYNTFDGKVDLVISDLKITTNARYWEKSVREFVLKYAIRKYGSDIDPD